MRPFHFYLISTGVGIAIGSIASWQKSSSESILRANSIQPSFPGRTTNLHKWVAPGANTLGSVVKPTNAKSQLSQPKRSELAGDVVSSNIIENSPSNNSDGTDIHTTSEQKIELPIGIASPLMPAESEGHIQNLQNSSSESVLLPNSIQAGFPIRNTNLQKWDIFRAINIGSAIKSTNANGKLSHPEHSEFTGTFLSSTLFETSPANNFEFAHIGATFEPKIKRPRVIGALLTPAESEGGILNLQQSSTESVLLPNPIQASFPVRNTNLQEWNAPELEFLGNTQQSQNSSNNAVFMEVKGREESASLLAQLNQSSPGNLPQQTLVDTTELDPNPNPLLRPSFPEEVQINRTVPITLQQALQLARRNNQQLQVTELELQRSRLALREIQSTLYPTVGIEAGLNRDSSAQGQLSVESQQRQFEEEIRQSRQQISQLQADLDALRKSPVPNPAIDPAAFIQRELTLSQLQSQLVQAQGSLVQTQSSLSTLENFATTTLSGSVTLNYDVFTSGRRSANIRAAEEEVRFNELELERAVEQLRLDVTGAFYNLQDGDQQVRIEEDAVRRATIILRDATLLREAQLATRLDEVNARVELDNAQQRLVRAQSQQQTARRELARLLNLPSVIDILAANPVQQADAWRLSLPESIVLALQNRAELEQQLVQRNISEQRRRSVLAALGPTVSVFASYNLLQLSTGDPSEFASRGFANGYSLGARMRWDLFDGGAVKARARQEEVNRAIAETRFADVSKQVRLDVERAYYNLTSSQRNIQTATVSLEGAREALRLARLRFQAGVGPLSDVITAESNVTEAEGNRVRAILDYNRALAALQRAISNLPDGRLNRVP
jgi:outer membrane protein TolC